MNHVAEGPDAIVRQNPEQACILIVGAGINFIDEAECQMPSQEAHRLRMNGRQLHLFSLKGEGLDVMKRGGCGRSIGEDNVFRSKVEAVRKLVPRLDPERCRVCRVRIFNECEQRCPLQTLRARRS